LLGYFLVNTKTEFQELQHKFQNCDRIGRIAGMGWNTVEFAEFDPPIGTNTSTV